MEFPIEQKHISVINKYPAFRDSFVNGSWKWIEGKRKDDNANGLWRVHDKLYNLDDFVSKHPGGKSWLEITKGTDITEAFESHHISPKASEMLQNFYVGDATDPRNYFYTYEENGFYQTLKKRVASKLKTVDTSVTWKSRAIHDVNFAACLLCSIMVNRADSQFELIVWALLAAQFLAWTANFSHNFVHQADNWRMYTSNISFLMFRDVRVFHVLSHHMYPNTYSDFEVSIYEPYYKWIPAHKKSWYYKILAILLTPVLYTTFFHNSWRYRIQGYIWSNDKLLHWDDILMYALPCLMILFGKEPVTLSYISEIYFKWCCIAIPAESLFGPIFINRGHHGNDLIHQNDEIKSFDFGEYQLSAVVDRVEANRNVFTSMAYYGHQVLHHLFPTLDHAILPQLKITLAETCKEFDIDLKPETTMIRAAIGQFKQLFLSETTTCT